MAGSTTTALGPAEEEASSEQQWGRSGCRPPTARLSLTGELNGDIDVVLREQTQQLLVGSEVHLSPTAIVLNDLSRAAVGEINARLIWLSSTASTKSL